MRLTNHFNQLIIMHSLCKNMDICLHGTVYNTSNNILFEIVLALTKYLADMNIYTKQNQCTIAYGYHKKTFVFYVCK